MDGREYDQVGRTFVDPVPGDSGSAGSGESFRMRLRGRNDAEAGDPIRRQSFVILSHESALALWRSEGLDSDLAGFRPLKSDQAPAPRLSRSEAEELVRRFGLKLPLQVTALSEEQRRNSGKMRCHIHNQRLPFAYVLVDPQVAVASPELVLLQLASELSVVELALLGSELAGRYALVLDCEQGFIQRSSSLIRDDAMLELLHAPARVKGKRAFSHVAKLMVSESRSPMETILALLLSLPVELGGYGLAKPQMNPRILVSQGAVSLEGEGVVSRYGDLVWPEKKLIVEYDSKANHDDYVRDTSRANLLMANGWMVITALPSDVLSLKRCNQLASNIGAVLGEHPSVLPVRFSEKQVQLRSDLFTASGTRCSENRNWGSNG